MLAPVAGIGGATVRAFGAYPDVDEPFDIKDGPDGWLWFTNKSGNSLGRIFTGPHGNEGSQRDPTA